MLLRKQELEALKKKVAGKEEPWYSAYTRVMEEAEEALEQEVLSVIQVYNSRYFKQDAVYLPDKDGVNNPDAFMKAGAMAGKLTRCCLILSTAWEMTGETKYAEKALHLIHGWTIDEATYMMPVGAVPEGVTPGLTPGGDIVILLAFSGFFLALAIMDPFGGWEAGPKAAVQKWVSRMLEEKWDPMFHNGHMMYNNWEDSRLLYQMNGALFLHNEERLQELFARWQEIIPQKMTDEGLLPREAERTRSMHYTLVAIADAVQTAETARLFGKDLYGYTCDGKNIKLALDYAAGYLLDMEKWPHQMLADINDEFIKGKFGFRLAALMELAYSQWQEEQYLKIIQHYGIREGNGVLATLRYGERFRL